MEREKGKVNAEKIILIEEENTPKLIKVRLLQKVKVTKKETTKAIAVKSIKLLLRKNYSSRR